METPDIRCFQHCDRQKNVLCFSVPKLCPICDRGTSESAMRIPPYLIESPFTDGSYTQCAILVKPTIGHFLFDFSNQSDLHISLTNSRGQIYEFDKRGVTVGRNDWSCCLSVYLECTDSSNMEMWDSTLDKFRTEHTWRMDRYDESTHNCYDFVIGFLRDSGVQRMYPCLKDKVAFCEEMIVPVTTRAGKYISLYRTISTDGYVIQNV